MRQGTADRPQRPPLSACVGEGRARGRGFERAGPSLSPQFGGGERPGSVSSPAVAAWLSQPRWAAADRSPGRRVDASLRRRCVRTTGANRVLPVAMPAAAGVEEWQPAAAPVRCIAVDPATRSVALLREPAASLVRPIHAILSPRTPRPSGIEKWPIVGPTWRSRAATGDKPCAACPGLVASTPLGIGFAA